METILGAIYLLLFCFLAYIIFKNFWKFLNKKTTNTTNTYNFNIPNNLEIKGAAYNICKKKNIWEGHFNGYLSITYNKHDEYAIGIFTNEHILVGYTPKKSINLYMYLKKYKIKKLPCEGYFTYQQYRENNVYFYTHIDISNK